MKTVDVGFGFVIGILFVMIIFFVVTIDDVDLDDLGEYMCEQHGLSYSHYEGEIDTTMVYAENTDLIIVCEQKDNRIKIDDGYLVLMDSK